MKQFWDGGFLHIKGEETKVFIFFSMFLCLHFIEKDYTFAKEHILDW